MCYEFSLSKHVHTHRERTKNLKTCIQRNVLLILSIWIYLRNIEHKLRDTLYIEKVLVIRMWTKHTAAIIFESVFLKSNDRKNVQEVKSLTVMYALLYETFMVPCSTFLGKRSVHFNDGVQLVFVEGKISQRNGYSTILSTPSNFCFI